MLTLIVDFNAARDGVVQGLLEDVIDGRELTNGALVLLRDGEGNEALGVIQDVSDGLVHAAVDWGTWGREGSIQIVVSGTLCHGAGHVIETVAGAGIDRRRSRGSLRNRLEAAEQLAIA